MQANIIASLEELDNGVSKITATYDGNRTAIMAAIGYLLLRVQNEFGISIDEIAEKTKEFEEKLPEHIAHGIYLD